MTTDRKPSRFESEMDIFPRTFVDKIKKVERRPGDFVIGYCSIVEGRTPIQYVDHLTNLAEMRALLTDSDIKSASENLEAANALLQNNHVSNPEHRLFSNTACVIHQVLLPGVSASHTLACIIMAIDTFITRLAEINPLAPEPSMVLFLLSGAASRPRLRWMCVSDPEIVKPTDIN